jgi:phosphoglycerate dehydrogenase-like enzyme
VSETRRFRVGFSADFLDENRRLVFPDIGLELLDRQPGLEYGFIAAYLPEYTSGQLADCDVLISLKPRVTTQSLDEIKRSCAIGRCGVGYDYVEPARVHGT